MTGILVDGMKAQTSGANMKQAGPQMPIWRTEMDGVDHLFDQVELNLGRHAKG
jgi:hypothetical protein